LATDFGDFSTEHPGPGRQYRHYGQPLSNFVVSLTFLSLLKGLGDVWTFLLYAALSLVGLWLCSRFVPETKGVPLERIERDLRLRRPLRDLGRNA